MSRKQTLQSLRRRICSWDLEPKRLDSFKPLLEQQLRFLPQIDWHRLKALDDPELFPCDLLVVYAWHLGESQLLTWLEGFERRIKQQQAIWIPALILTPLLLPRVEDLLQQSFASNWYFDLMHPDHISSMPIRVANLLRIHDHLHELQRYERELERLQGAVIRIEAELEDWKKGRAT